MRLPLVVLDFAQQRARRYWPKPGGGFVTDDAALEGRDEWNTPEALAQIEAFRMTGGRERKVNVPMGPA